MTQKLSGLRKRKVLLAFLTSFHFSCVLACKEKQESQTSLDEPAQCERLFGAPNENTGLTSEQCAPECLTCENASAGATSWSSSYTPTSPSAAQLEQLRKYKLKNPPLLLEVSPYLNAGEFSEEPTSACGAIFSEALEYRLETFETVELAQEAGATLTHMSACGACSSLQDLAVYIEIPDLTEPVRNCALNQLGKPAEATIPCLEALGFSASCAEIWAYNTKNTRDECFIECISAIDAPYHLPSGAPNECISCDEEKSGAIFKSVSGRTRRNSGLPTALCRPCAEVERVTHDYP